MKILQYVAMAQASSLILKKWTFDRFLGDFGVDADVEVAI